MKNKNDCYFGTEEVLTRINMGLQRSLRFFFPSPPAFLIYDYPACELNHASNLFHIHPPISDKFYTWMNLFFPSQRTKGFAKLVNTEIVALFGLPHIWFVRFFFSRNSVFLSQQFSQNSVFSQFQPKFCQPNGPNVNTYLR